MSTVNILGVISCGCEVQIDDDEFVLSTFCGSKPPEACQMEATSSELCANDFFGSDRSENFYVEYQLPCKAEAGDTVETIVCLCVIKIRFGIPTHLFHFIMCQFFKICALHKSWEWGGWGCTLCI